MVLELNPMKTIYFYLFISFLSIGCTLDGFDEGAHIGIAIDITNMTNREYNNLKLHIGGLEDSAFVSTDSYNLPTIPFK